MSIRMAGRRKRSRGYALIVALALVLGLTVVVAYTQGQVVQQLMLTKTQRDYERALQLAEAGANAYLNMIVHGSPSQNTTNASLVPQPYGLQNILSIQDFRQQAKDGTIPPDYLIKYPSGQTTQGYFAAQVGPAGGVWAQIVAYGWSNGVVRRVQVQAVNLGIFDWAALYGLNPNPAEYALQVTYTTNIVGTVGAEGLLRYTGPQREFFVWDGPLIWARNSFGMGPNNVDVPVRQSSTGAPPGHVGTGTLANPVYLHYGASLAVPTADDAANMYSGSAQGTGWFRSHNDNATGLRLLVRNRTTGVIRELTGNYEVVPSAGPSAYKFSFPDRTMYTGNGMAGGEEPFGVRAYPGNYFFEQVDLKYDYTNYKTDPMYTTYGQRGPTLALRSFTDAERSSFTGGQRQIVVQNDPANPNPGQSANQNVRFFLGHAQSGPDLSSQMPTMYNGWNFYSGTVMEYTQWTSRFRMYGGANAPFTLQSQVNDIRRPEPFYGGLLMYNKTANGTPYGMLRCNNTTYLRGSAMGWQVDLFGKGCTFEKGTNEVSVDDRLAMVVTQWSELQ